MVNKLNSLVCLRYVGPIRRAEWYGRVIRLTRAEATEYQSTGMWVLTTAKEWRDYRMKQKEKENGEPIRRQSIRMAAR